MDAKSFYRKLEKGPTIKGKKDNISENPYEDETAKLLREGNYEALLNKQVQTYNLKNQAQKYYRNELAAKGVESSGYGNSANLGINNQAINMYQDNVNNYNKVEKEITQDAINRYDAKQTESDNQLTAFIQNDINTTGGENVDKYLENFGYKDGQGNFTDKFNKLSDDRKSFINSLITSKGSRDNYLSGSMKFDFSDLDRTTPFYNSDGEVTNGKIKDNFEVETNALHDNVALGKIPNGSTVKLVNGSNSYLYVYYKDGNFYYQTKEQYESNPNKFQLTYNKTNKNATLTKGA